MSGPRYFVLGLARPRAGWFTEVASWCSSAVLPVTYRKCVSAEEARAHLEGGRTTSALLVDASHPGVDRDLLELAASRGCCTIVVGDLDSTAARDMGVAARLPTGFDHAALLDALVAHAALVPDVAHALTVPEEASVPAPWEGRVVAVCGPGGTGTSTVAACLAQGMAADPRLGGGVVLADLALRADQAVLHGTADVVPALAELVDAHRRSRAGQAEIRRHTFDIATRGYRLLLGLRRQRDWATLRPAHVEATLQGLRQAFRVVVADTDADVEGEDECGSADVGDRNLLARSVTRSAHLVVVVGHGDLKGVHALVRTMVALREHGVAAARILPVVNEATGRAAWRAEVGRAVAELWPGDGTSGGVLPVAGPVFLPRRGAVEAAHRDGHRMPRHVVGPLTTAVGAVLARAGAGPSDVAGAPVAVAAGSLGSWSDDEEVGA